LPDEFPIKNGLKTGYALLPLLQSMPLGRFKQTRRVEMDGTHQLLFNADDVHLLCESTHDCKEKQILYKALVRRLIHM
jgi:hypothetical protein